MTGWLVRLVNYLMRRGHHSNLYLIKQLIICQLHNHKISPGSQKLK